MEKQIVLNKIIKARQQRLLNNCYSMEATERCMGFWQKDENFMFSWEDHGVQRLTYFSLDWHSLDDLLSLIDRGKYYLEFMTKDPEEYSPVGAKRIAAMMRLSNPDCRSVFETDSPVLIYRDHRTGEFPQKEDAKEINSLLWATFRTEISHLLTDEEVAEKINQFIIHRSNGVMDAILQADIMPKKFYINQIVNKGEKKNIHAMLLNRLETYANAGGKYLYAWVEEKNIASQKFHAKYDMRHDGMWNMVYCIER